MHAYLVVGQNNKKVNEEVEKLIEKLKLKKIEFPIKKIADIRELEKFTNLTLSENTAIVINDFNEVGNDAQNAFLKSLEEPQEKLTFILTSSNEESVLPTIASRCLIIDTGNLKVEIESKEKEKIEEFLNKSVGEKLLLTSKITKKEDAIEFTTNLIIVLHELLKKDPAYVYSIEEASKTLSNLRKNGNVQIQLTNLVVSLNN